MSMTGIRNNLQQSFDLLFVIQPIDDIFDVRGEQHSNATPVAKDFQMSNTLKDLIVSQKCRKGTSAGKTKEGAYWLVCPEVKIRSFGGGGFGNDAPDETVELHLRHYRNGEVKAVAVYNCWHQNMGSRSFVTIVPILDCQTTEEVIVKLLDTSILDGYESRVDCYSSYYESELTKTLASIGLPVSEPSPDEGFDVHVILEEEELEGYQK